MQMKTAQLLETDDLQFSFKNKTSTSHALYVLKSTIEYFNSRGSNVYVAFFDCTKDFDRISHDGLFLKTNGMKGAPMYSLTPDIMVFKYDLRCQMGR